MLEKIGPERVGDSVLPSVSIRIANQLGNDVKVTNLRQKCGDVTELNVCIDLLEVRLPEPAWVALVILIGSITNAFAVSPNALTFHDWATNIVLAERELVAPTHTIEIQRDVDDNV